MTKFDEAARAASSDIRKEMQSKITMILQSCQALGLIDEGYEFEDATVIPEGDGIDVAITKHFAPLAGTYAKLVELAVAIHAAFDRTESTEGTAYGIRECHRILADPRIAALLAEKKG